MQYHRKHVNVLSCLVSLAMWHSISHLTIWNLNFLLCKFKKKNKKQTKNPQNSKTKTVCLLPLTGLWFFQNRFLSILYLWYLYLYLCLCILHNCLAFLIMCKVSLKDLLTYSGSGIWEFLFTADERASNEHFLESLYFEQTIQFQGIYPKELSLYTKM